MSGNVEEWCFDYYADWGTGELTNPVHWSGRYKIVKGGSIRDGYDYLKLFDKYYNYNYTDCTFKTAYRGIRIARNTE